MGKKVLEKIYDLEKELVGILNSVKVGVYIADAEGTMLLVNDESCMTNEFTREEMIGMNVKEFVKDKYIKESCTLKVIETGEEASILQNQGKNNKTFITGVPYYKDEKLKYVICTEVDVTETSNLQNKIKAYEEKIDFTEEKINHLQKKNKEDLGDIVAESPAMKTLIHNAKQIAIYDTTVLITGNTGVGKEIFANYIYENSSRKDKPFITVNCAAVPENLLESEFFGYEKGAFTGANTQGKKGLFELANGGTLLLDEIGELPLSMQSKLLRVLQEKEFMKIGGEKYISCDVRIIAATNKNLKTLIEEKLFREDLYYRLNIIQFEIPPLKERKEDIPYFINAFSKKFSNKKASQKVIIKEALNIMQEYSWPGNVRELHNIVERIFYSIESKIITAEQIKKILGISQEFEYEDLKNSEKTLNELMEDYEKRVLNEMFEKYKKGNIVAEKLGMNEATLSRRVKKYNIK